MMIMASNKVQIEILLNFNRFEECGEISYEVVVINNQQNKVAKDKLECPYCTEIIDVKFSVLEEHLEIENEEEHIEKEEEESETAAALNGNDDDDEERENSLTRHEDASKVDLDIPENGEIMTEGLKESLLNELYDLEEETKPLDSLSFLNTDESLNVSDSDETLSTCTLLNIKYQKEIEDAIESMKINTLDESSLIDLIEKNTINILNEPEIDGGSEKSLNESEKSIDESSLNNSEQNFNDYCVEVTREQPDLESDYIVVPGCEELVPQIVKNSQEMSLIPRLIKPDSTKSLSEGDGEESSDQKETNFFHLCPCKRVYKLKKFFLKHMKQYHPDFSIDDCEKIEPSDNTLVTKAPKRDGSRPIHRCNVCVKVYWSRRSYRRHMVCCHPDEAKRLNLQAKTYRCQYCDKIYFTSELLHQHSLLHVNPDHYQCGYCNKSFATHNNLKRHINAVHLRIKSYICEVCGVRFNQRYSLRLHHQELHGTDGRYECNDCGKTYGSKDKLKCHIKWTHYGYGKTECKFCGKSFLMNNYKRHLRDVHKQGQQLEYPCRFCDKIFNRRAYRDIHECTHTGEKRFSCKFCNERFTDPGYRYAHIRRCHSPEFEKRKKRIINNKSSNKKDELNVAATTTPEVIDN